MSKTLAPEVQEFNARLQAADPAFKKCVLVVITVTTDGVIEVIANVKQDDLDSILEHAKRNGRSGEQVRTM